MARLFPPLTLALFAALLTGCGTTPQFTQYREDLGSASMSTKTQATGLWLPFGRTEAFLTQGQERALHAVQDYEKQVMRTRPVDYHYEVRESAKGYTIKIHYGLGHEKNQPILPGASIIYEVDQQGRVQHRTLG